MTKHLVTTHEHYFFIDTFKDSWRFTEASTAGYDDPNIDDNSAGIEIRGSKNTVFIDGDVMNHIAAVRITGADNKVEIGEHAYLQGGIDSQTQPLSLINSGTITFWKTDFDFVTASPMADAMTNHGTIKIEVRLGEGNDRFVNDGFIDRTVDLGGGNDTFVHKGATSPIIIGGAGDDTLITSEGSILLTEGAGGGSDTVRTSDDYILSANVEVLAFTGRKNLEGIGTDTTNLLRGNKGNNILDARAGSDVLEGGKGNDTLSGGIGKDTFYFGTGDGKDVYADFEPLYDHFNFTAWKDIQNFAALKQHASTHGDAVWIVAGNDRVIIDGATKADLDAHWFNF